MNRYYQSGGQEEQLMQLFQLFADTVQDDEFSTAEEVMQMFQELSPEEQQAFVQQAMQIVQQEQSEPQEEEQMELEEEPTMQRGGYVNNTGYLEGYETSENPYNIIPSNKITMKGVDPKIKYIKDTDNLGNTQYMEHGGEYEFDGDFVLEEPVYAQDGADIKKFKDRLAQIESKYKGTKTAKEKLILNRTKESLQNQIDNFQSLSNKYENLLNQGFGDTKQAIDLKNRINKSIESMDVITPENYKDLTINTGAYSPSTNTYIFESKVKSKNKIIPKTKEEYKNTFIPNTDIEVLKQPKEGYYIGSDGNQYYSKDKGKSFEVIKDTSLKQDKPKVTLPPKKVNKEIAKQVATPDVLTPPPSVTTGIVDDTFDYRQPLIVDSRFDKYSIPEEERTVELNPNVFNRTNIGVGKRFFKQNGGYYAQQGDFIPQAFEDIELPVNKRLNYNAQPYVGAKTNFSFPITYTNKTKLFPKISEPTLDPIGQYDSMPMGAISANYEAPNQQSRDMFEDRASNQLLDLSSYANRFGVEHFGLNTTPVSDQTVNRKSKFQEFMDKFGKKSDLSFDSRVSNIASAYNLMKASEPLTPQYRPNVRVKYAETPMLDPLPIVQELYNQNRLATQNVNTNSPTGQAFLGNLNAQTQQKTIEVLNDIQQKNNQIAAQNEQARIAAYNDTVAKNIMFNQAALQGKMMAEAKKEQSMGESLANVDKAVNNFKQNNNNLNVLAKQLNLKEVNNFAGLSGKRNFNFNIPKVYYNPAQIKTQAEVEAAKKAYEAALKKQQESKTAQTGGRLNSFFKNKSF